MTSTAEEARRRLADVGAISREVYREWHEDRVSGLAAEVAFWALLSVFPLLLAIAGTLGLLQGLLGHELANRARDAVTGFVSDVLTEQGDGVRQGVDQLFTDKRSGILTVAALGALWSSSRGFHALIEALTVVYDIEDKRKWVRQRSIAIVFAIASILVGALLLAALVLGPLLGTGDDVADAVGAGGVLAFAWDILRWPVVALVVATYCTTLLHFAANHHTPWRKDLPGAVFGTVWAVLVTIALRLYLESAAAANPVLGTLGGSIVAVLWLYFLALGLLIGGEVNAVLEQRRAVDSGDLPTAPVLEVRKLQLRVQRWRRFRRRASVDNPPMPDFNTAIIDEFRANEGKVGGGFDGAPMVLLHTTGARSGQERVNPMMYSADGDRIFVFASKAGADTNPDWYHNLLANPDVTVELGGETFDATARPLEGEERGRIFDAQKAAYPGFAEYEQKTSRVIPVVELIRKS